MGAVESTVFVVVDGAPASRKSTLAPQIAQALRLPLLAKDTIKDALMAVVPPADVEQSRQLGRAAVEVMLALAAASPVGAVRESNFYRSRATVELRRLPGLVVEVFCRCSCEVARDRYRRRAGTRDAGHFDTLRTDDELWNEEFAESHSRRMARDRGQHGRRSRRCLRGGRGACSCSGDPLTSAS